MSNPREINEFEDALLQSDELYDLLRSKLTKKIDSHLRRVHGVSESNSRGSDEKLNAYNNLWERHEAQEIRKHIRENGLLEE